MSVIKNIFGIRKHIWLGTTIIFVLILFSGCSKLKDPLPKELYTLKMDKKLTGKEANEFLSRMHSGDAGSAKNDIGFYSGDKGGATIYVSYFEDKNVAQAEATKMTDKISLGKSAFTDGNIFYFDGLKIYKCFGYSQSHFIFSKEKNLYWLTADSEIDRKFLSEYLDYLNK